MKIFIDSAKIDEISKVREWGLLDGVTTNPSLIKKASDSYRINDMERYIISLLSVAGKRTPVSFEVIGTNYEEMVREGKLIARKFGKFGNVFVKIPVNPCLEDKCNNRADGIKAIKELSLAGIKINCTLIFTPEQALLAARAGAKFVSPFVGREDDYIREMNRIKFQKEDYFPSEGVRKLGRLLSDKGIASGVDLIAKTKEIFLRSGIKSQILAASIRNARQFRDVAMAGADIATMPFNVINELLVHYKTKEGMRNFTKDIIPGYAKLVGYKGRKNEL